MRFPSGWSRALMAAVVLSTPIQILIPAQLARAQGAGTKPPVQRGLEYYEQSRFDEAIQLLRDLVDRGALAGEEMQRAREILARSYVKKGYPAQAKEMFKAILRENPTYRPDPIRIPPDETAVFEQALREAEQPSAPKPTPPPASGDTTPSERDTPKLAPVQVNGEGGGKKPLMKQWWVWALGAVAVGGVVAAAAGGGGGDDGGGGGALPGFPGPPSP